MTSAIQLEIWRRSDPIAPNAQVAVLHIYVYKISMISTTVVIVLALVGNALTVTSYIRDQHLRNVYNLYIVNLACTDFLLGLISMPFYAVYTALKYTWPFGDPFCKAYMTMDFTLCMESILMMIILSWDRVLLLRNGPGYTVKVTKVKAMWVIGGSWVIAFLLYGPAILMYDVITGENNVEEDDCDVQFANDFVFTFITALLEFVIPFVCLCLLNFYIYFQIRKRSKVRDAQTSKTMATISKSVSRDNGEPSQETSAGNTKTADSTNRRDRKAAKNLALLLVVFLVTWAPYTITTILISACESCVNEDLYEFLNWLLWAKAALNPFLYAYNNPRFRENFLDLLVCFKCFRVKKGAPATAASTMVSNA